MQIVIDANKCIGCQLCAKACHMGVIAMVDGKARVEKESACDGLGRCLPLCPTGAITIMDGEGAKGERPKEMGSQTAKQWPLQLNLVLEQAWFFENCHLLIAADCTAFAYPNFHKEYMDGKVTLIGCPKLDEGDYSEKLRAILSQNAVQSLTVARMEVPCCSGIVTAAEKALEMSGKNIPFSVINISTEGEIL